VIRRLLALSCLTLATIASLASLALAQEPVDVSEDKLDLVNPPATWRVNNSIQRLVPVPLPTIEPATFSDADRAKGLVVYCRPNPRHCRYSAKPASWEVNVTPRAFVTPGQYEPLWFSVYSLKSFTALSASLAAPFTSESGDSLPDALIDIRYLRDWPQLRSLYVNTTYYVTPELLEKKASIDLPAEQSRTIWLTLRPPATAKPGLYRSTVRITSAGQPVLDVPVELRVLPFSLITPRDRYWAMYTTSSVRYGKLSDDALRAELIDLREHGINSIVLDLMGQTAAGITVKGDAVKVEFPQLVRFQRIRKEINLPGPLILLAGPRLENQLVGARGQKVESFFGPLPQQKDPVFNTQFREVLTQIDRIIKETGQDTPGNAPGQTNGYADWYYAGIDEPGVAVGRYERALWEFQQARQANIKTWTTLHGPFSQTIGPWTNVPVFHRAWSVCDAKTNAARAQESLALNQDYWVYGGGAYENQEGNLIQNRHHNGVLMYRAGLAGFANWTYQWPSGNPMSDFYSGEKNIPGKKAMITYIDPATGQIIPTLQWEGIRAGIDDYRYFLTLDAHIAAARKLGKSKGDDALLALADRIRAEFDERLALVPWADPLPESFDMELFDNDRAAKLRWFAAEATLKLRAAGAEVLP
jgi:hypothetical protein